MLQVSFEESRNLEHVREQASEIQKHSQLVNEVRVNKKLLPKYKGPFVIKKCLNKICYCGHRRI